MADSIYQLNILGRLGGQFVENVLHFDLDTSTGSEDPATTAALLISSWQSAVEPDWKACLPTSYILSGYKAKRITNGGGPTVSMPVTGIVGTRTGIVTEQSGGPCIIGPYSHGGRFHVGRIFLPGVTQLDCVAGVLQAGLVTAINSLIADLAGSFGTGGTAWTYTIYERKLKIATIPITLTLSLKVGIQKRRLTPVM